MKAPKVKAVLVGTHHEYWHASKQGVCLILPADAESYERMVEQMAVASMKHFARKNGARCIAAPTESTRGYARAELRAIGITPRTGKGRK